MKITEQLDRANEDLLRIGNGLPELLRTIRDAMPGQPGAASYDTPVVHGHATVLDDEGIPMPAVSDPTGETAADLVDYGDPAHSDLRAIKRHVSAIASHADALVRIAASWQRRPPTRAEQRKTASANVAGCDLHAKAGLFAEREPGAGLIAACGDFVLPEPMHLCSACRSRIKRTHRVPSRADLHHHRDHGKWPTMLATNYRGSAA